MAEDRFYTAPDGLHLHYVEHPGDPALPPAVLLHGLTRNPRDFEGVAPWLNARGHRVIVPAMRGRGESAWAQDARTYAIPHYLLDLDALWSHAALGPAVFIGTSMGGIITMLTAATRPGRVLAAALNDIGPVIERAGVDRIAGYVGRTGPFPDWGAAADALARTEGDMFPDYTPADWLTHARRRGRERNGAIIWDYDPRIAEGFGGDPNVDPDALWRLFDALGAVPLLTVRGSESDILSAGGLAAMVDRRPDMIEATVPRAGHAPSLEEPEARAGLERLLTAL